jgi:thymidine kinase
MQGSRYAIPFRIVKTTTPAVSISRYTKNKTVQGGMMSKLNFKYGAMNCGKSDLLIKTAYNYTEQGLNVVAVTPQVGLKKPGFITARAGGEWPVDIATTPAMKIRDTIHAYMGERGLQCVLVDEAQFLTTTQIDDLERIAKIDHISVIAHGLRSNVQRQLFDGSKRLFELADAVEKMPTMCTCGAQAEYNGRFLDDVFHVGDPIVMIDTVYPGVRYQSMCATCYLEHFDNPSSINV